MAWLLENEAMELGDGGGMEAWGWPIWLGGSNRGKPGMPAGGAELFIAGLKDCAWGTEGSWTAGGGCIGVFWAIAWLVGLGTFGEAGICVLWGWNVKSLELGRWGFGAGTSWMHAELVIGGFIGERLGMLPETELGAGSSGGCDTDITCVDACAEDDDDDDKIDPGPCTMTGCISAMDEDWIGDGAWPNTEGDDAFTDVSAWENTGGAAGFGAGMDKGRGAGPSNAPEGEFVTIRGPDMGSDDGNVVGRAPTCGLEAKVGAAWWLMGVVDNWEVEGRGRKVAGGTACPGRDLPTTGPGPPGILDWGLEEMTDWIAVGRELWGTGGGIICIMLDDGLKGGGMFGGAPDHPDEFPAADMDVDSWLGGCPDGAADTRCGIEGTAWGLRADVGPVGIGWLAVKGAGMEELDLGGKAG